MKTLKIILFTYLVGIFISCGDDETMPPVVEEVELFGITPSDTLPVGSSLTDIKLYKNISYGGDGAHERHVLDFFKPKSDTPTALVIAIHGGSFVGLNKEIVYVQPIATLVSGIINSGKAFANLNYRYITQHEEGVKGSMMDVYKALQFIRTNATKLNIDPDNIVLAGQSAGAGTSLWIGTQNDMNEGIKGVVAWETQATYNVFEWDQVFSGFDAQEEIANDTQLDGLAFTARELLGLFYPGGTPTPEYLSSVHYLDFIDSTDPPLFFLNEKNGNIKNTDGSIDTDIFFHSVNHEKVLIKKCKAENAKYVDGTLFGILSFIDSSLR